jgi:hypothetical protein
MAIASPRAPVRHLREARVTLPYMESYPHVESKLANDAKQALIIAARRLTPEQRLNAFLAHCQLMMELYAAGQKLRPSVLKPRP